MIIRHQRLLWACVSCACLASVAHAQAGTTAPQDTIITSDGPLEMRNDGVEAYFVLTDNVHLTGTNLEVTCDKLEAYAERKAKDEEGFGGIGGIRRIVATGHVIITQEGRRATAGRAEVIPADGYIVLTENPEVTEPQGTIAGERMEIRRGEENARVFKPRVVLRELPNFGFPRNPETESAAPAKPEPSEANADNSPAPEPSPPPSPAP